MIVSIAFYSKRRRLGQTYYRSAPASQSNALQIAESERTVVNSVQFLETSESIIRIMFFEFFFVVCLSGSRSANILGVFPGPSISHQVVYRVLMREVHTRNHNITIVITGPSYVTDSLACTKINIKNKSYHLIRTRYDIAKEKLNLKIYEKDIKKCLEFSSDLCELQLSLPNVQKLIQSSSRFDFVFFEYLTITCMAAFGYKLNASLIGISSLDIFPFGSYRFSSQSSALRQFVRSVRR